MALDSYVGSFNITSTAAVTTVAVTGVGFLPKVIIFWWNFRTESTNTVGSQHARYGIGWTAGVGADRALSTNSEDAQAASDTTSAADTSNCVVAYSAGAGIQRGRADLASFDADGFTLDITDTFHDDIRVGFMALGGSDITNVAVGTMVLDTVQSESIETPGFLPNFLLTASAASGGISVGMATGASNEFTVTAKSLGAEATTITGSYAYGGEVCSEFYGTDATSIRNRAEFTQFDAAGFDINVLDAAQAKTYEYLVIAGANFTVGDILTRTDGADIAVSGLGYDPSAVMFVSDCQAEDAQDTPRTDAIFSIGAASALDARVSHGASDQTGLGTTECNSIIQFDSVYAKSDLADGIAAEMDIKSFDTGGFTCVMDDTEPTVGSFVGYLAVGPSAGLSIPIAMRHYLNMENN